MEDQKTIIVIDKETLLFLASAIIVAGMASNYSTVCPSETHALIANGVAEKLMEIIRK
jgi:hypothetical protein